MKGSVFPNTDLSVLIVWFYLFCISLIFQSLFITVFFTRAKIGNIVGMVFFLLQYFVVQFVNQSNSTYSRKQAASIASHTAISLSCDVFLLAEAQGVGISWSTLNKKINNYTVGTSMGFCLLSSIIFFILFVYLDQVFPNEWGK